MIGEVLLVEAAAMPAVETVATGGDTAATAVGDVDVTDTGADTAATLGGGATVCVTVGGVAGEVAVVTAGETEAG